jgi:hypothetical protein
VIANLTRMMDEIHRIYLPGMERFFAALQPDLWVQSVDELEPNLTGQDDDVALRALAIYRYRRLKMLEIYRAFMELAQKNYPKNPVIEAIQTTLYAEASEQTTRRLVRCDSCGKTPELVGQIRIFSSDETNQHGDPVIAFHTACIDCDARERSA